MSKENWNVTTNAAKRTATLKVMGFLDADDALAIGQAFMSFAAAVEQRPWAMISDLREMSLVSRDGQKQWVDNMVNLMGVGLKKWAVLNRSANAALQSEVVAKTAQISEITKLTTDEAEARRWVEGV
jgi:hypothetical protein